MDAEKVETPQKRQRACCIFNCAETDHNLNSPRDSDPWHQLVRAAEIRGYDAILQIASGTEDGEVPEIFYHRQCRNRFTKKRDLDSIATEPSIDNSMASQPIESKEFHMRRSSVTVPSSRVYQQVCIICLKTSRYVKRSNTREPLIKCSNLRTDHKIFVSVADQFSQYLQHLRTGAGRT